jgi:NAD(P)-dependent dehydrogenase (short-subunit alcohol dehydrogenase family)
MGKYDSPTSILITGASSGIGSVLAQSYARDGVTLALGGRNRERLEAVADAVRAAEAQLLAENGVRAILAGVQDAAGEECTQAIRDAGGDAHYRDLNVADEDN